MKTPKGDIQFFSYSEKIKEEARSLSVQTLVSYKQYSFGFQQF